MTSLSSRFEALPKLSRRVLALLAVPLSFMLVVLLIWMPVAYMSNAQADWRKDAGLLLSKAKSVDAEQTELNAQLAALQASGLWTKFYAADQSGAGATSLQSDVSSLLAPLQVSAQSLAPIPSAPLPHFTRIGTRLTASMRIDQLKGFLAAVATHQRYLRIEQATIVAPQSQRADENPPLAVTLEVYGYELAGDAQSRVAALPALALHPAN